MPVTSMMRGESMTCTWYMVNNLNKTRQLLKYTNAQTKPLKTSWGNLKHEFIAVTREPVSPAEEGPHSCSHGLHTSVISLAQKHGFNLRVPKYIRFFYHQVNEGKERTPQKKYIYIYLYSSQLYINFKNKFTLAGNGEVWEGTLPTANGYWNCKH